MTETPENPDDTTTTAGKSADDHVLEESSRDQSRAPVGKTQRRRRPDTSTDLALESEEDAENASSTAPESTAPESITPRSSGGRQISITITGAGMAKAAAVVVAIALIAGVAWLGWGYREQSQRLAAFDDSTAASEKFVQTLVTTLNTENAGNSKELLGPLSTGDLRKRLEQDRAATEQNVQSLKIEASATIKSSSVRDFTTEEAHTVVMAEVKGTSTNVPNGATNLMIFLLDLRKVDGQWLVASVDGPPGGNGTAVDPAQSLPGTGATPAPPQDQPAPAPAPQGG